MLENELRPRETEAVFPEAISFLGTSEKADVFVELLKKMLPMAKSDDEIVGMEVRAALEVSGTEVKEEVAKVVTDALLATPDMKENALMVAHKILKGLMQ